MKIFFLIDATFSERDFTRFGIDVFIRNDIQVYLWDFSDLRSDTVSTLGFEEDVNHKKVNDPEEFEKALSDNDSDKALILVKQGPMTLYITLKTK